MRMTTYSVPATADMVSAMKLPLGVVVQPLAETHTPVPVIDVGAAGPVRCQRCRAYINPAVVFTHGGQRFTCSLCAFSNEVTGEYFCNLDAANRRLDTHQRPELRFGTVEYVAPAVRERRMVYGC